jgi:predicted RNase H-like nuclease
MDAILPPDVTREGRDSHVVAGVDGCRAGWVFVILQNGCRIVDGGTAPTFEKLLEYTCMCAVVGIDIPIGLPDSGARTADRLARKALGPTRSSSVFAAPKRGTLSATSYPQALALSRAVDGVGLSKQTFFLLAKIREVDEALLATPRQQMRVREVHPEVSFRFAARDSRALPAKKTAQGGADRDAILERHFSNYGQAFLAIRHGILRRDAQDDDIRDACIAAWTAHRISAGQAISLPSPPEADSLGIPMAIYA